MSHQAPRSAIGRYARDRTTGIAGRITSVCLNEREDDQWRLKRYGVDAHGKPQDMHWAYVSDCDFTDESDARHG